MMHSNSGDVFLIFIFCFLLLAFSLVMKAMFLLLVAVVGYLVPFYHAPSVNVLYSPGICDSPMCAPGKPT